MIFLFFLVKIHKLTHDSFNTVENRRIYAINKISRDLQRNARSDSTNSKGNCSLNTFSMYFMNIPILVIENHPVYIQKTVLEHIIFIQTFLCTLRTLIRTTVLELLSILYKRSELPYAILYFISKHMVSKIQIQYSYLYSFVILHNISI